MKRYTIILAAVLLFAAACSSPGTSQVSIDIATISTALTAGDLYGSGAAVITLTAANAGGDIIASKTVPLPASEIELSVPGGTTLTFTISITDAAGTTVYYTGTLTADVIPGTATSFTITIDPAVTVEPPEIELKLGQIAPFAAIADDGSNPTVLWAVNGVTGGSEALGAISQTNPAIYTAPPAKPQGGLFVSASYTAPSGKVLVGASKVTLLTNVELPAISSFTPAAGAPGAEVTINGQRFGRSGTVSFNGAIATDVPSWTETAIKAIVPQDATSGKITVQTPAGSAVSPTDFNVNYPLPVISGFSPGQGIPGTAVTIVGSWFGKDGASAPTVEFNGTVATVSAWSQTSITTTVPEGATAGRISVATVWGSAVSSSDFTVNTAPPVITDFSPASGVPGMSVTINGQHFGATGALYFAGNGGLVTAPTTAWTDTQVVAVIPLSAKTGPLTIEAPSGTATSATAFTVEAPAPTITALHPPAMSDNGGDYELTVAGSGFDAGAAVHFGAALPASTVKSTAEVSAAITKAMIAAGEIDVTVVNGDGKGSNALKFRTYTGAALSFTAVSVGVAQISSGQSDIPVTVTLANAGEAPASLGALAIALSKPDGSAAGADFILSPQFTLPETLAGGSAKSYLFLLSYAASPAWSGTVTVAPTAAATDGFSGAVVAVAPVTGSFKAMKKASVAVAAIRTSVSKVNKGQSFTLTADFVNNGEADADLAVVKTAFTASGVPRDGDFSATASTSLPVFIAGNGGTYSYSWQVTAFGSAQSGPVSIDVSATASDVNTGVPGPAAAAASKGAITVQIPAALRLTTLNLSASTVNVGQAGLQLTATVANSGEADARLTAVTPAFKDSGAADRTTDYTITPVESLPIVVTGGATITLHWVIAVKLSATKGAITASMTGAGVDLNTSGALTMLGTPTGSWAVQAPAAVSILSVNTPPKVYLTDTAIPLSMTVENNGTSGATITAVTPIFTDQGGADVTPLFASALQTALPVTITGGATQQFSFVFDAGLSVPAGTYTVQARVDFQDVTSLVTDFKAGAQSPATLEVKRKLTVTAAPPVATVYAGSSPVAFTAIVKDEHDQIRATGVNWTVEGGSATEVGTIDTAGNYLPPASRSKGTATIRATSAEDPSFSATATATIKNVLTITVTPGAFTTAVGTTKAFTAVVKDESGTVHATGVNWTVEGGTPAQVGTIDAGGLYTAPATLTLITATIRATSVEDTGFSGAAALTLKHALTVTVTPGALTVYAYSDQNQIPFTAEVRDETGTTLTGGVAWTVEGGTAGQVGTVGSDGGYTPPNIKTVDTAVLRATSVDDPTFSGAAMLTIKHKLDVWVSPGSRGVHLGKQYQFTVQIQDEGGATHASNVTWTVEGGTPAEAGTINAAGLYSAPSSLSARAATIRATSVEDPSFNGTAPLTIWPAATVTMDGTTDRLNPGMSYSFAANASNVSDANLAWYVNGVAGGNAEVGTVTSDGGYTAPVILPAAPYVTLKAESVEDPDGFATTTVVIAMGYLEDRWDLTINPVPFDGGFGPDPITFSWVSGTGMSNLLFSSFSTIADACGIGCDRMHATIQVENLYNLNLGTHSPGPQVVGGAGGGDFIGTIIGYYSVPAGVTPVQVALGTSTGPGGHQATASAFVGDVLMNSWVDLYWEKPAGIDPYTITVEIVHELPELTGDPVGGPLNAPIVLPGQMLGTSALASEGSVLKIGPLAVPEGSITDWTDTELDFVVPVGAATGTITATVHGFPALGGGIPFTFGLEKVVDIDAFTQGSYNGGAFWVNGTGDRVFYSGLFGTSDGMLYGDSIPSTGPVAVGPTVNPIVTEIMVSGNDLIFPAFAGIYRKNADDLDAAQVLYSAMEPVRNLFVNGTNLYFTQDTGEFDARILYGDYTAAEYLPQELASILPIECGTVAFVNGLDATAGGDLVFGALQTGNGCAMPSPPPILRGGTGSPIGGMPSDAYLSGLEAPTTPATIGQFSLLSGMFRSFWLNPAGDGAVFAYDDYDVDGPGLYTQPLDGGVPVFLTALNTTTGELAAAVGGTKLYYLYDDEQTGYQVIRWKDLAGPGVGHIATVDRAGRGLTPYLQLAGGHLYFGCGTAICRMPQ